MKLYEALKEIIENGQSVRLPFWNPETRVFMRIPCRTEISTHPYLAVKSSKGIVPWKETYPELFADNWEFYKEVVKNGND